MWLTDKTLMWLTRSTVLCQEKFLDTKLFLQLLLGGGVRNKKLAFELETLGKVAILGIMNNQIRFFMLAPS